MRAVGLDPGYGLIKVATAESHLVMPSYVATVRQVGLAASGLRLARATIVRLGDSEYAIGEGAPMRGAVYESVEDARFLQEPSLALFLGAIARALPVNAEPIGLAVGLPVALLQHQRGQEIARNLRRLLSGQHRLEVDGKPVMLHVEHVWVRAQPLGIWAEWALDDEGQPLPGARRALVGVVDIGWATVDLIGIQGGQVNADMVAGADLGVRVLLEDVSGDDTLPLHELAQRFADGSLMVTERHVGRWATEIAAFVRRRWRRTRPRLAILAGGGAALLEKYGAAEVLKAAVSGEVLLPGDPVTMGARGLRKLASGLIARETVREALIRAASHGGGTHSGGASAVSEGQPAGEADSRS